MIRPSRFIVCCLMIAIAGRTSGQSAESRVEIAVDPRVELLSAALTQSAWSPSLKSFFSPYAQDIQKAFFPFRSHEAVKRLDVLRSRGVSLRAVVAWITDRGALPSLEAISPPDPAFAARAGGTDSLDALASALAELAGKSNFTEFISSRQGLTSAMATTVRAKIGLPDTAIERLENYTGMHRDRYHLIVAPLFGLTSFSWSISAGKEAFVLVSPAALRDGLLSFDTAAAAEVIPIGFGRLFAREALQAQPARLDKHSDWYPYLADHLRRGGLGDWSSTLAELIAATVAIRLTDQQGRKADMEAMKRAYAARGLVWLPYTLTRIAEYEDRREQYRTIKDFTPRLLDMLDELEPVIQGGEPGDLGLADVWLTEDGVPVKAVAPGSPAAKAGLRKGDTIQAIAGIRINGSESYLKAWDRWEKASNNEAVPFRVKRGKQTLTVMVVMKRAGKFQGFRRKPPT